LKFNKIFDTKLLLNSKLKWDLKCITMFYRSTIREKQFQKLLSRVWRDFGRFGRFPPTWGASWRGYPRNRPSPILSTKRCSAEDFSVSTLRKFQLSESCSPAKNTCNIFKILMVICKNYSQYYYLPKTFSIAKKHFISLHRPSTLISAVLFLPKESYLQT
jgi:hypothetical protein